MACSWSSSALLIYLPYIRRSRQSMFACYTHWLHVPFRWTRIAQSQFWILLPHSATRVRQKKYKTTQPPLLWHEDMSYPERRCHYRTIEVHHVAVKSRAERQLPTCPLTARSHHSGRLELLSNTSRNEQMLSSIQFTAHNTTLRCVSVQLVLNWLHPSDSPIVVDGYGHDLRL